MITAYDLIRHTPGFGVASQTGVVAEIAQFTSGQCVLRWLTEPYGIEIYASCHDLRKVREASGRSELVKVDSLVKS